MLHRLVELSRDPPFALHARRQIPLAFHGAFHGMKRRLQKVKPDEARQEIVETHRSHSRLVSVVVSTLSGTDIEASVSTDKRTRQPGAGLLSLHRCQSRKTFVHMVLVMAVKQRLAGISRGRIDNEKPNSPEYVLRLRSVIAMAWLWYQRVPAARA
jgi:hypothetical protein